MIANSHAVIDPWTVVIKPLNTSIANGAMPRPWRPHNFAIRAALNRINQL